jgi:hypothetical protein
LFEIKEELLREVKKMKRDRGDLNLELNTIRNKLMTEEIRSRSMGADIDTVNKFAQYTNLCLEDLKKEGKKERSEAYMDALFQVGKLSG